jgi:hypothetical protein
VGCAFGCDRAGALTNAESLRAIAGWRSTVDDQRAATPGLRFPDSAFPAAPAGWTAADQHHARSARADPRQSAPCPDVLGPDRVVGPRYCPSIEDKVVRFAERETPRRVPGARELRDDWIYCNGISTSLPRGCAGPDRAIDARVREAEIMRYGYAVEYDMVRPHQIWRRA